MLTSVFHLVQLCIIELIKQEKTDERLHEHPLNAYREFPDEQVCKDFIVQERWNGNPICPSDCGHDKVYEIRDGMGYKCAECKERFSVRTGSLLENSRLPLQTWLLAIYIMTTGRKGISSVQFAKELGITQKTGWYLANRIREACADGKAPLIGEIEMDATYIGGKEGNKHASKRMQAGRGTVGKTPVMGMKERGGRVKAEVVEAENQYAILNAIKPTVEDLVHNLHRRSQSVPHHQTGPLQP